MTDNTPTNGTPAQAAEQVLFDGLMVTTGVVDHVRKATASLKKAFGAIKASNSGSGNKAIVNLIKRAVDQTLLDLLNEEEEQAQAPATPSSPPELNDRELAREERQQEIVQEELEVLDNQDNEDEEQLDIVADREGSDQRELEVLDNQDNEDEEQLDIVADREGSDQRELEVLDNQDNEDEEQLDIVVDQEGNVQGALEVLDNQDNEDEEQEDIDQDLQDYRDAIGSVLPEEEGFIETFKNQPRNAFEAPDAPVERIRNGHALPRDMSAFDKVYLVEDKEGLNLEVPELTFQNLNKFLDINEAFPVIDCDEMVSDDMPLRRVLEAVADKESKKRYNVLALEFSQIRRLARVCSSPEYVRKLSMVEKLERKLKDKIKIVNKRFKKRNTSARAQLRTEKKECEMILANLPQYEKFLLLSMKDSFTDAHMDMAATAVFFHVIVGKKIFYVAPPTPQNIADYKKYQIGRRSSDGWLGEILFEKFQKVEINAGNTALIPPGWIHFVYTPEHSIVFGGNFLLESGMDLHSEYADFEKDEVERKNLTPSQTFQNFENFMFAYAKYCVLPEDSAGDVFETKLLGELKKQREQEENRREKRCTWFEPAEQEMIIKNLQDRLGSRDVTENESNESDHEDDVLEVEDDEEEGEEIDYDYGDLFAEDGGEGGAEDRVDDRAEDDRQDVEDEGDNFRETRSSKKRTRSDEDAPAPKRRRRSEIEALQMMWMPTSNVDRDDSGPVSSRTRGAFSRKRSAGQGAAAAAPSKRRR